MAQVTPGGKAMAQLGGAQAPVVPFALTPNQANNAVMDFTTKAGQDLYM